MKPHHRMYRLFAIATILALLVAMVPVGLISIPSAEADAAVFINEIHYDNDGTDAGEAIEIAGPAGTDLTGWSLVLYNGNGGTAYSTTPLDGTLVDLGSGFGVTVRTYPSNGIQNGSPDGVALVDSSNSVVQFLSYEGTITAADGPAAGTTSVDIGVSEGSSTPTGYSLQLTGAGTTYDDFTWAAPAPETFGSVNTGQTFGASGPTPTPTNVPPTPTNTPVAPTPTNTPISSPPGLSVNEIVVSTSSTDQEFFEISGASGVSLNGVYLLEVASGGVIDTVLNLAGGAIPADGYWVATSPEAELDLGVTGDFSIPDNTLSNSPQTYLLAYQFSGASGDDIDSDDDGTIDNPLWSSILDSIAVVDAGSAIIYSTNVVGPDGTFLAPGGYRCPDNDGAWTMHAFGDPSDYTPGSANACGPQALSPVINEFSASTTGTDVEYVEVYGSDNADYSAYTILEIEGDSSSNEGTVDEVIAVGSTDASGFWLGSLAANTLENGTITLLLVRDFSGATGADLDPDDDGVLDSTPWVEVVDAVAVNDGGGGDLTYGVPALGPNYDGLSTFPPGGASRYPDGLDTDAASDWVRNDFDLAGIPGFTGTLSEGEALNTPGEPNQIFVPPAEACGDPYTPIYEIQGSGAFSPLDGSEVATEGVVVGDFQNNASADDGDLGGFHIQDPAGDADPSTSDGIFVFASSPDVAVGDRVRVRGTVDEFFSLTEITGVALVLPCGLGESVAPTTVSLPVTDLSDLEPYEGMQVTFPETLYISEFFNFDRFGEIVLTTNRQYQPTAVEEPGSPGAVAVAQANALSRITLDDGRGSQNPDPAIHPNGMEFTLSNRFRGGDTVQNVTGVMDFAFGLYRIQPTEGADYTAANPRPGDNPDVGGDLQVAAFNVLNYFTTLDLGPDICGPSGNLECRGADNAEELARQRAKIVDALAELNADVVGLIEIQNDGDDASVADLVAGVNAILGAGTYDYIATGFIGTDAIKQAFIYRPAAVSPIGGFAVLDSNEFVDPNNLGDPKNRPALAQTFLDNGTGGLVTVVVNHFKSKGSSCGPGDDDPEQGNCNLTRTLAAQELLDWLAGNPTGFGTGSTMIIGDLNAYDKEDPIDVLRDAGYADLLFTYQGELAYSFVFDGQLGYLDYAMSSGELTGAVTGAATWHINADEPDILDYDTSFKQPAQDALYQPNEFRSSDHDPVLAGVASEDIDAATLETLKALLEYYVGTGAITGNNTEKALADHLEKAERFLDQGQDAAYQAQLLAFINQVQGFAPEFVTQDAADILSIVAGTLMDG